MKNENGLGDKIGLLSKLSASLSLGRQVDRNNEQFGRLLSDPELFREIDELHKSTIPKLKAEGDIRTFPVSRDDLEAIVSESSWLSRQPSKTRRRIDSVVKRFLIRHGIGSYAYDWLEALILYQNPVGKYPKYNFDLLADVMDDKVQHVTYTAGERKLISDYVRDRLGFKTRPPKSYSSFWRGLTSRLSALSNTERRKPTLSRVKLLSRRGALVKYSDQAGGMLSYKTTYLDLATLGRAETEYANKQKNVLKTQASRIRRKYGFRELSPKLVSLLLKYSPVSFGYRKNPNEKQLHKKTRARNSKSI
jgi:hypothetical protein